jgi:hypothetical protein
LKEQFQGVAKVVPRIRRVRSEEIERLQFPDGSRKRQYFIDLRQAS